MCRSEAASVVRIWNFDFRRMRFELFLFHLAFLPLFTVAVCDVTASTAIQNFSGLSARNGNALL